MNEKKESVCKHCRQVFEREKGKGGQQRRYCSDACRVAYWRRQDSLRRQATRSQQEEKVCPNCGKRFHDAPGYGHRKYCCETCRREYNAGLAMETIKRDSRPTCQYCGGQFEYSRGSGGQRRKYCSDACRLAYWREHRHLIQHKAVRRVACQHCGKEFEDCGNRPRKYCSRECYTKHLETLQEIVTCLVCGRMFLASKKQHRKYCSQACMAVSRTRLAIERWEDILPPQVEIARPGPLPVELNPVELEEPLWILSGRRPKRIILVCKPLDFWNSWIDFLCHHIQSELGMNPLAGDIFVFCNSKRTEIRMLQERCWF